MELNVFVDGGSRGNPGKGAIGVIIIRKPEAGGQKPEVIHKFGRRIGVVTNNEAEYQAVIEALKTLASLSSYLPAKNNRGRINIHLDSRLVCQQLRGFYKVKNSRLRQLLFKVRLLEQQIKTKIYYHLIPREKNRRADKLVNQALDKA